MRQATSQRVLGAMMSDTENSFHHGMCRMFRAIPVARFVERAIGLQGRSLGAPRRE